MAQFWLDVMRRMLRAACWLYFAVLCALAAVLYSLADRWWIATLIMFSPRWVWGLPLVGLLPLAIAMHRRLLWLLSASVLLWAGLILHVAIPWPFAADSGAAGGPLRIMTCNADGSALDAVRFKRLIDETQPDIVVLQDAPSQTVSSVFDQNVWQIRAVDRLTTVTRHPIGGISTVERGLFPVGGGVCARSKVQTPVISIDVFNVHLASPRAALQSVMASHFGGANEMQRNSQVREEQSIGIRSYMGIPLGPTIVLGDFNTPVESQIHREVWEDFRNAFSAAGYGVGNTHFTTRTGVRIDHILVSSHFSVHRCWVAPDVGSAHRPVIADVSVVD